MDTLDRTTLHEFLNYDTCPGLQLSFMIGRDVKEEVKKWFAFLQSRYDYAHNPIQWHVPGLGRFEEEAYHAIDYVSSPQPCTYASLHAYYNSLRQLPWNQEMMQIVVFLNISDVPSNMLVGRYSWRPLKFDDRKSTNLAEAILREVHQMQTEVPRYIKPYVESEVRAEGYSYCDQESGSALLSNQLEIQVQLTHFIFPNEPSYHYKATLYREYKDTLVSLWSYKDRFRSLIVIILNESMHKSAIWEYKNNLQSHNFQVLRILCNGSSAWGIGFYTTTYNQVSLAYVSNNWAYSQSVTSVTGRYITSCEVKLCGCQPNYSPLPLKIELSDSPRAQAMMHRLSLRKGDHSKYLSHITREYEHLELLFVDWKENLSSWCKCESSQEFPCTESPGSPTFVCNESICSNKHCQSEITRLRSKIAHLEAEVKMLKENK